ncbi:DUF2626 family protein [Paenibacillus sp. y28]|uniref:DUF2626 family protein n=1 Tax=Paenibacillus sp. y28 TaxID=3129110 RepID=UPI0030194B73
MPRMFRVLGFWALVIGLMALAGHMTQMALLFFAQAVAFALLGYMNLSERSYVMIFWGYLFLAFIGFSYWTFFEMSV